MIRYLLLFLLCSLSVLSNAQNCKFAKNEVDEFTGAKVVFTKPLRLTSGMFKVMVLELKRVDDRYFIDMTYVPAAGVIPENGELMLKLEDEQILTLRSTSTEMSRTDVTAGMASSYVTGKYAVTKEQLVKIQASPFTKARMYFVKDYGEIEVSESGRKKIVAAVQCILSVN